MKNRPNKNLILDTMRDGDTDDIWGLTMAWSFAVAENLSALGEDVPPEMGYQPAPCGPVIESYEDMRVQEFLGQGDMTVEEVQFAGKCLARLNNWLRAAGKDY